jgi:drug/metabolite transporter (DMT)-like permease
VPVRVLAHVLAAGPLLRQGRADACDLPGLKTLLAVEGTPVNTTSKKWTAIALALAPALFVFLWSTGWISARAAAPYADPLTFLAVRYALAGVVMLAICFVFTAPWPTSSAARAHAVFSGALLHAGYLGPVWYVVAHGVPAGVSGVLAGAQPLLTALLAPWLAGERISLRQWGGILVGFIGILLVLQPKIVGVDLATLGPMRWLLFVNALGMISVTLGTFYQKRFIPTGDLRTIAALQYVGAVGVTLPAACLLEPNHRLEWHWQAIATMAWSVLAISIGAILIMLWLIRSGAVSRVGTLIYLVPPVVAAEAWLLFGEQMTTGQMLGVGVVVAGVALAMRK